MTMTNLNPTTANVGDGATLIHYTDRTAYTIIGKTAKSLTLQRDRAKRLTDPVIVPGGFAGHCTNNNDIKYEYSPDPKGQIVKAHWSEKKQRYFVQGTPVSAGRSEFYDYNF
jgi:hypothetical protein